MEFNLDFLCAEHNLFHFGMTNALSTLFSRFDTSESKTLCENISMKLSSILPTIGDFHNVQILYNTRGGGLPEVSEYIAKNLAKRIE